MSYNINWSTIVDLTEMYQRNDLMDQLFLKIYLRF